MSYGRTPLWPSSLFILLLLLSSQGCRPTAETHQPAARQITVAAASDLAPAFEELGREFERETGIKVIYSFGSSGMLAKQIEHGAPMDVYAAANVAFVDGLERLGLIIPETKALYARGRLVIWTRADSSLRIESLADLAGPQFKRIAIANPDHAPYGTAAREAFQTLGLWETVRPKCVLGENVRQTLQYAETGNVEAAVVAHSLSIHSSGRFVLVPEELHRPLDQALAVIKSTRHEEEARRFASFVNDAQGGRPILQRYGLMLPRETSGGR